MGLWFWATREEERSVDASVLMQIEQLRQASVARLREKHRELFGEEARSRHREQLFRRIAWRLQALSEGDLSERARKRAQEIARDADLRTVAPSDFLAFQSGRVQTVASGGRSCKQDRRLPLPGTVLHRKFQGRDILVEVLGEGFRYQNRHYRSLSAIANEVTGTRWNGLAFFGLIPSSRKGGKDHSRA
jgi:hypothetical protein